ncbi:MAG: alanine racemase [Bacteroidales bacterium]
MRQSQFTLSRTNLLYNYNFFRSKLSLSTKLLVLVKANAYGHGDIECSKLFEEFGADYLGVALPNEGIRLKNSGIKLPVIILTPGFESFEEIIENSLEPSIINLESALMFIETLSKLGISSYPVHIKLDTGMHRVGFEEKEIPKLKELIISNPNLRIKSVFSHLSSAEEPRHDEFTRDQINLFKRMSSDLISVLDYKPLLHILNSSGIERFADYQMDMVRLGVGIYGTSYVDESQLKPAGSLQAPIIQIKEVTKGSVGYGRHGVIGESGKIIATVPLGYADGVNRRLGRGSTSFMLNGKRVPTIGNICMDTFMLDITGVEAKVGDVVTIFGESPTAGDIAKILNTISYEVYTSVSARVKRVVVP